MKRGTLIALAAALVGCTGETELETLRPEVIRLGVLPDQSADKVIEKYAPLVDYLSGQTALDIELVISEDYASMLDDFSTRRVHLANFGGLIFTEAERRDNAEPLVMRDVDLNFASCYLVRSNETRQSVDEFRGDSIAFGPRLSTSGHLMPRYFLQSSGVDPFSFFSSVRHSSGHDETATWVQTGEAALGVANCIVVESMVRDGRLSQDEVRILETTPAYSDYVWAVHEHMDAALKIRLRDAFLALDITLFKHQEVLGRLGAHAYLPASRADFEDVRQAARSINVYSAASSQ